MVAGLMSFRGRFDCRVDVKGRLSLPAPLRLTSQDQQIVITNSLFRNSRCLDIYTLESWMRLEEKISGMPTLKPEVQAYQRFYLASAQTLEIDGNNRILIPAQLRKYCGLEDDAVVVGMGGKIELWSKVTWDHLFEGMASEFENIVNSVATLEADL